MLNSEQYSFNDINLMMGGRVLNTLQGMKLEFGYEQDGARNKAGKRMFLNETNFDVEGSFKILQSDLEALIETYGDKLQKTYFDIVWNFASDNTLVTKTHVIKRLKLGKTGLELNQGDSHAEIEIPFVACDVKLNK